MLQTPFKRISDKYKKTLVDLFPEEFNNIEQLSKYEKDEANHTNRFGEKIPIQIIYHPKDIIKINIPVNSKQRTESFVKRARPRSELYFNNKPEICLPKEAKQIIELKIIRQGYSIDLLKEGFKITPQKINYFEIKVKEELNFNNKENRKYIDFYVKSGMKIKYGYLGFSNQESQERFMETYLESINKYRK